MRYFCAYDVIFSNSQPSLSLSSSCPCCSAVGARLFLHCLLSCLLATATFSSLFAFEFPSFEGGESSVELGGFEVLAAGEELDSADRDVSEPHAGTSQHPGFLTLHPARRNKVIFTGIHQTTFCSSPFFLYISPQGILFSVYTCLQLDFSQTFRLALG